MFIKKLIVLSSLALAVSATAQSSVKPESYIVTRSNDTIFGKIKKNIWIGGLKLVTADGTYKIDPDMYTAYYNKATNVTYRSKVLPSFLPAALEKKLPVPRSASWLKCIEDGKIKLYEYKSTNFGYSGDNVLGATNTVAATLSTGGIPDNEYKNWYIEKDGYQLTPIKHNSFVSAGSKNRKERKELLKELLADSAIASARYSQTDSFSFKTIQMLIHGYNNPSS